jgi:hypothetical protein
MNAIVVVEAATQVRSPSKWELRAGVRARLKTDYFVIEPCRDVVEIDAHCCCYCYQEREQHEKQASNHATTLDVDASTNGFPE